MLRIRSAPWENQAQGKGARKVEKPFPRIWGNRSVVVISFDAERWTSYHF